MKSRTQKNEEAKSRALETKDLTPQQRLDKLDKVLGVGLGAKKERAKLQSKLS